MKCNKKQLSDIFGISERTFTTYQGCGLPFVSGGRGKENEYDTLEVFQWLCDRDKSLKNKDPFAEKARLTKAQADKEEFRVLQIQETLIDSGLAKQGWMEIVERARAKFLPIPQRLAPLLILADGPNEIAEIIRTAIEEALIELSDV